MSVTESTTAQRRLIEAIPGQGPDVYRFSVEQYRQLIAAGIFGSEDRVELMDGWIVSQDYLDKSLPRVWTIDGCALPLYSFSRDQYHRMGAENIIAGDDRVELLEGVVCQMNPVGTDHAVAMRLLEDAITPLLPPGWFIRSQLPIAAERNEVQPDLAVVRGKARDYRPGHPGRGDLGLLIEVSDSTLSSDRKRKGPIYAEMQAPEYWIINLIDRQVEVLRDPRPEAASGPEYATRLTFAADARVPFTLDGQSLGEIAVAEILP